MAGFLLWKVLHISYIARSFTEEKSSGVGFQSKTLNVTLYLQMLYQ